MGDLNMNEAEKITNTIMEINLSKLSEEQLKEVISTLELKLSEGKWRLNAIKFHKTHHISSKNNN